ncbi:LysR family transcriptional regulator [Serratia rhizosphaerae]|uniref:LysR family transcriptional regulator n=1 Tax=unclassified Serratia (in: enterobacteria) TaxID=2647522 RepID=UPI000DA2F81C|nr:MULTISPECIES: LysR family transcriptional regulator [unclassified Serratia (in: enterobacteria)]MBU3892288.1 LysR family transcriptional regulator [Serratia rubidaea]QNK30546.1 LysR family transcriptional regulator [Serratia sp. JUb9]QPT15582.1 LysR family transcriptional regulator [Serratia rubidaea]CAE1145741.1 Morphology and auto-aggregation control protein [Serratia sp. Tan611]SQJ20146.1 Morphology and auto-aggregation control protein [Serratia rubidaea]
MDIKQLIYLCNLERERHFGRAAEASFVSQPTLSMRLKNLEKELGVALINRGNNFEGFTAEGERVLAWAREIVSVYQGLKLEVESLKHGLNGTLVIGAVPQCSIMLAQLLKSVSAKFPRLDFRVSVLSADQLLEALTAHTVDIGIGFFELQTLHELHFQSQPLEDSGVDLLFHPQHFPQLVGDTPLTLREVADLPLCLAEPSRYFRRYIDQNFRDAGLTLHTRLETSSLLQLLQGIFVGLGCGIFPRGNLLPEMTPQLQRRSIAIAPMTRHAAVVVAEPGRATPLAQHFFDAAQSWLLQ